MRLKNKIVSLSLIPVFVLGTLLFVFASNKIETGIYEQAYTGMHATTLAVRNSFEVGTPGEYHLDENGELWKGDTLNISQSINIADSIKNSTGMEFTIFYNDTRYLTSITDAQGNRQVNTQASDKVVEQVLKKGLDYYNENVDILGTKYIVYYIPIFQENTQTPVGMIFLGLNRDSVIQSIRKTQMELLIIVFIIMIAVFVVSFILVQKLVNKLSKSIVTLSEIASGRLGLEVNENLLSRPDEIGDIYRSVTDLDKKMLEIIGNIKEQSDFLADTSTTLNVSARDVADSVIQVDTAVQEIAIATNSQSEETQSANKNVEIMGSVVEETSAGIIHLNDTTTKISEASQMAATTLSELDSTMINVINSIELIYKQTHSTADSVSKISEVTNLITDIAAQTNLLSLNASIEAARAGEHGKGFAVVATEIQKLANQSRTSATEIQEILHQLNLNSNQAVSTMGQVRDIVVNQKNQVEKTDLVFQGVQTGIVQFVNDLNIISNKTTILDNARKDTITVVNNLSAISEENAASTEETAASIEEVHSLIESVSDSATQLSTIALELKSSINFFKIKIT